MHVNHPQTIPPPAWFMEKVSSSKEVFGAKKLGDCSSTTCEERLVGATTSWLLLVLILAGKERHKEILTQMAQGISHETVGYIATKGPKTRSQQEEPKNQKQKEALGTRREKSLQRRQIRQKLDKAAQGWEQQGGSSFLSLLPSFYLLCHWPNPAGSSCQGSRGELQSWDWTCQGPQGPL